MLTRHNHATKKAVSLTSAKKKKNTKERSTAHQESCKAKSASEKYLDNTSLTQML